MKKCTFCKKSKPLSDFNNWKKAKDGKQHRCRGCQNQYQRDLYARSEERRASIRRSDMRGKSRNRDYINSIKESGFCKDCGEDNPLVLSFDHLHSKEFNISDAPRNALSLGRIKEEIAKCELVCLNCHAIRTHNRRPKS